MLMISAPSATGGIAPPRLAAPDRPWGGERRYGAAILLLFSCVAEAAVGCTYISYAYYALGVCIGRIFGVKCTSGAPTRRLTREARSQTGALRSRPPGRPR